MGRKPASASSDGSKKSASDSSDVVKKPKPATKRRSKSPGGGVGVKSKTKATLPTGDLLSPEERSASDFQVKVVVFLALVVPWIVAPVFGVSYDGLLSELQVSTQVAPKQPMRLAILVMCLSTPHVFYAWTWTHASQWAAMCHKRCLEPFKAFAMTAHLIKAFQIAAISWWVFPLLPANPLVELVLKAHPLKLVLILQLFSFGQILNVAVYNKIGEAGVYYGTRLGINVPWVYGPPFSIVPHPQYFGATLSFIATFLLISSATTAQEGIHVLSIAMTLFYAISSYVEANL